MFDARRPLGWLFYLLLSVVALLGASVGQTPATTTISDIVYRADGTLAGGTLLISWPDVQHLGRAVGGRGEEERNPGAGRCVVGGIGSEHGREPGRHVLHRRLSTG